MTLLSLRDMKARRRHATIKAEDVFLTDFNTRKPFSPREVLAPVKTVLRQTRSLSTLARNVTGAHGGDLLLGNRDGGGLEGRLILPR